MIVIAWETGREEPTYTYVETLLTVGCFVWYLEYSFWDVVQGNRHGQYCVKKTHNSRG